MSQGSRVVGVLIALTVLGAGVLGVAAPTSAAPVASGLTQTGDPKVDAAPIRSTDPQLSVPVRDLAVSAP
ncbi:MAG TPA: hypothetical protein PLB21_00550, partial [Actinomycetota bacterium]|nr:hypothetical protein [Actinomycetota bacterium]